MYEYPDGSIEIRNGAEAIAYSTYDRLSEVSQGAIVDNKRLAMFLRSRRSCRNNGTAGAADRRRREPIKACRQLRSRR